MPKYIYEPKEGYMTPGFVPGETYEGDFFEAENFRLLEEAPKNRRRNGSIETEPIQE